MQTQAGQAGQEAESGMGDAGPALRTHVLGGVVSPTLAVSAGSESPKGPSEPSSRPATTPRHLGTGRDAKARARDGTRTSTDTNDWTGKCMGRTPQYDEDDTRIEEETMKTQITRMLGTVVLATSLTAIATTAVAGVWT